MTKETKEEKELIKNKLQYLKLDLTDIPEEVIEYNHMEYSPSKSYEDASYKVYRYVDVRKIQILLTNKNRLEPLNDRYKKSVPLEIYLNPKDEQDIEKHTTFLKMLREVDIDKIEEIEKEQKLLSKDIPFKIKYPKNFLWQIFYDIYTQNYFMLVPTEDKEQEAFFYLLKQKIQAAKTKRAKKIFIPISYLDYNNEFLKKSEIEDLERYLWLFTKDWPMIYEVYDKKDKLSIQIVGNTKVYEKIKSFYKITLEDKEKAISFYKLLKAIFILQTELSHYYNFETKISSDGGLEFLFNNRIIEYENLSRFIKEEFLKYKNDLKEYKDRINKEKLELEKITIQTNKKEKEYLYKERQIATYMECRKSFLGKVKYFFKLKKIKKQNENDENDLKEEKQEAKDDLYTYEEKEFYTIEDLIQICKDLEEKEKYEKNILLDKKAMENKHESMTRKLKNATQYIQEIEEHKKSIFEFWKFANKDEVLTLTEGEQVIQETEQKLSKTFNYEEDMEELGAKMDKAQRENLSKKECDAIFLTDTNILKDINKIRENNEEDIKTEIENLKKEKYEEAKNRENEEFDVFGSISEDKTKIKSLGNKKHREIQKNKLQILDIMQNTSEKEYIEKIKANIEHLKNALQKNKTVSDLSVYISELGKLSTNEIKVLHINPENALDKLKEEDRINLYRINLKIGANIIALTNSIYFDNKNETLPIGMDVSDKVVVDLNQYKLELKRQKLFRMNQMLNNFDANTKIICVYEYDVV